MQAEFALKLLPRSLDPADDGDADGAAERRRLLLEARRLARVRHPNVLVVYGVEEHDGRVGVWTDLLHGRTLEQQLHESGAVAWEVAARIGVELCRALQAVHEAGLIHGDLSAANVMQEDDGAIRLLDFGSVVEIEGLAPLTGHRGTPLAMAPEVLRGQAPRPTSDLYSLAGLLFRLVTGRHVVEARSAEELRTRQAEAASRALDWQSATPSPSFAAVVERALRHDPAARFASARAMESALDASLALRRIDSTSGPSLPHNLPSLRTSFIGRESELDSVRQRLRAHRLVTLLGPGGSGKTRLAVEAARDALASHPGGVHFLELASISQPEQFPWLIASSLGVREQAGATLMDTIRARLEGPPLLLVLDNCEHLLPGLTPFVEMLLDASASVRVLATSRELLRIAGEEVARVLPLSLPELAPAHDLEALLRIESVRLFVDRAASTGARFALTEETAPAVVEICRRLDGIPLAIELAAARVRSLSVQEIVVRLDSRFRLLRGVGEVARHQTLGALLDWSHERLEPEERSMLAAVSIFEASFRLPDAAALRPEETDPWVVLDLLSSLVDKSLLEVDAAPNGETRYRLLETVRAYAAERLTKESVSNLRDAHLRHVLAELDAVAQSGAYEDPALLDRLSLDHANLRAALRHAIVKGDLEAELAIGAGLRFYWFLRGHWAEARRAYDELLVRAAGALPSRPLLSVLSSAGNLAWKQGDLAAAREQWSRGLEVAEALGNERFVAALLDNLAIVDFMQLGPPAARRRHDSTIAIYRRLGDDALLVGALTNLATAASQMGDAPAARAAAEEALTLARRLGERRIEATLTGLFGSLHRQLGESELARAAHEEHVRLCRELANPGAVANATMELAFTHAASGELDLAESGLRESLAMARQLGFAQLVCAGLGGLGRILAERGELDEAERCLKEGEALARAQRDDLSLAEVLGGRGAVHGRRGDVIRAANCLGEGLAIFGRRHEPFECVLLLEDLVDVAWAVGAREGAVRVAAAVEGLRMTLGAKPSPVSALRVSGWARQFEQQFDATALAALRGAPESSRLDEVVRVGLEVAHTIAGEPSR